MSTSRQNRVATKRKRRGIKASSAFGVTRRNRNARGFTLLESLIAVGLAAMLLAVYTAMLTSTFVLRRGAYNIQAANFIQEELDALRSIPFEDLTNRTDGSFLGLALQRGHWEILDISGDKALGITTAATEIIDESGLVLLPGNYRENFTLSSDIRVDAASPAGWDAGLVFRYRDPENHYRFRFSSGGIALDRVLKGTVTTLWSQSTSFSTGVWYNLELTVTDDQITLVRDAVTLTTQTDATFLTGDTGLFVMDSALAAFDDVAIDVPIAESWDFEAEDLGTFPLAWQRLSYDSLPSGNGTLTLTDYLGQPTIKQATVTVSWSDAGSTRSNSGSVIIAD